MGKITVLAHSTGSGLPASGVAPFPYSESPKGTIDGSNKVFTLTYVANQIPKPILIVNGATQDPGNSPVDFTVSGNTITYAVAPEVGATHYIWYWYGGGGSSSAQARQFDASAANWSSDVINWGTSSLYNVTGDLSIGCWLQLPSNARGTVVCRGEDWPSSPNATNTAYCLGVSGTSGAWNIRYFHRYGTVNAMELHDFATAIPNGAWKYVGLSRNSSAKTVSLYLGDGASLSLIESWTYTSNADGGADSYAALTVGNQTAVASRIGLCALVGAFADSSGNVILPVYFGDGATYTVPTGATQLQLGTNDDNFSDNVGSFSVTVNGTGYTVPGTAMPWVFAGGINSQYPFGAQNGTAPVVISGLTAGASVTVAYVSGTVSSGYPGDPNTDANGVLGQGSDAGSTGDGFPSIYMNLLGPLVGTVQQHYISRSAWSATDHQNAMGGAPPATGLVLACSMGNSPEVDTSGNGGSGAVTGTTLVAGH